MDTELADARAYLISWRCYGTWLHGESGAFDPRNNTFGAPGMRRNDLLADFERENMRYPPMQLSTLQRESVARTITETARIKNWTLLAANVRTNHVHIVVSGNMTPERIMSTLKSWCTRRLREAGLTEVERPIWSRHGSTVYLWTDESVDRARWYVEEMQDEPGLR